MEEDEKPEFIDLSKKPTPEQEQDDFSTAAEKRKDQEHNHSVELKRLEMEAKKLNQGPVGMLFGCTDSTLNVAFVLAAIGFVCIAGAAILGIFHPELATLILDKLFPLESAIIGYVFGKKTK
ncbi:MAG: hypothetical protein N4A65_00325 [Cohaesibacter sp.]|jgi:hypothetical protein|nr:hypothetical protein [Cohaesibacter sp.]